MNPMTNFKARQVENGWVVTVNAEFGCTGPEFVFRSLDDLADWLKVQVVKEPL